MKRTAVLIYDLFCNFEISPALEILALCGKPVTVFAVSKEPVRSEDGLTVLPDESIENADIDAFDSLLLPGAADIRSAVEDDRVIEFIKRFDGKLIGAVSIAPVMLVKAGLLSGRPFMAGINREELYEEGFTDEQLARMVGWDDNLRDPVEDGYIVSGNIVTSVSCNFVRWGLKFGQMAGCDISPRTFGLG